MASYNARCIHHSNVNFQPLLLPFRPPTEALYPARRRARRYYDADSCYISAREPYLKDENLRVRENADAARLEHRR